MQWLKSVVEAVKAYVIVTMKRGTEHDVTRKIWKMKEVTEVFVICELYDLVVRIEAESLGHLDKIVTDIWQMAEIKQNSTLVGTE